MYDGVHIGHRQMLKELTVSAKQNDACSCVVTFSNHPRQVLDKKGDDPVQLLQTTEERFEEIARFGVDYLVAVTFTAEFASLSPKRFLDVLLQKMKIKVLLLGYDNRFGNPNNNEYEELLQSGYYRTIKVQKDASGIYFQGIEVSSTQIRKALACGDVKTANNMLGYPYRMTSKVIKGLQNGRKMGFPTANIDISRNKLIPFSGVYATKTVIDGKTYKSVTNIGNNPTFNASKKTVETYIIGFNEDIYDRIITIEFVDFIRRERKFSDIDGLISQMQKDVADANEILS